MRPDGTFALPKTWRRRLGGLRQPCDQRGAHRLFEVYAGLSLRRVDRMERERIAFRTLVGRADWRTLTSGITREVMADAAGVCVATISTYLASWLQAGLIRVVLDPLAPCHARGRGRFAGAGRAPIYALTAPPDLSEQLAWWEAGEIEPEADGPLEVAEFSQVSDPVDTTPNPTQLAESPPICTSVVPSSSGDCSNFNRQKDWPGRRVPVTYSERLRAARHLGRVAGWGHRVRVQALLEVVEPFFQAEWCLSAVLWALDHRRDGERYVHTDRVRAPAAWVRFRLAAWLDEDGRPMAPPVPGSC